MVVMLFGTEWTLPQLLMAAVAIGLVVGFAGAAFAGKTASDKAKREKKAKKEADALSSSSSSSSSAAAASSSSTVRQRRSAAAANPQPQPQSYSSTRAQAQQQQQQQQEQQQQQQPDPIVPDRLFTPEELSAFDGRDSDTPIYMAVSGIVFDVSSRRDLYGEGGYSVFAGKDASIGLATMQLEPAAWEAAKARGLTSEEQEVLADWVSRRIAGVAALALTCPRPRSSIACSRASTR
jgi:predicted heme/steroid binding protein